MKNKNLIIGGSLVVATFVFLRLFLKKGSEVKADRIQVADEGECPLNKFQDEERMQSDSEKYRAYISQCKKNNPLAGFTFGGKQTINNLSCAERYDRYKNQPTSWIDLDCSEKEKKAYKEWMDKSIKNSIEDNKKGLVRPFLNPTSNIAIAKLNGYFDENKNYYKHCGTEICWVFNEGVGWTKES